MGKVFLEQALFIEQLDNINWAYYIFQPSMGWLTSLTLCCFLEVLVSRMIWMREVSGGGYSTGIVSSVVLTRNYLD